MKMRIRIRRCSLSEVRKWPAVESGIISLQTGAERRLVEVGQPHFLLRWKASRESADLISNPRWPRGLGQRGSATAPMDATPSLARKTGCSGIGTCEPVSSSGPSQIMRPGCRTVALSPDGRYAISSSGGRALKLWDLMNGQFVRTFIADEGALVAHDYAVRTVAISHDGRRAVAGCHRTVRLWDLQTGQLLRTFAGLEGFVTAVAMSSDGNHALAGSSDSTLKLWDLMTGDLLHTLYGHKGMVRAVSLCRGRAPRALGL